MGLAMKSSLRLSSVFGLLFASASLLACDVVVDPTGSDTGTNTGAIQGSGAACEIDTDCPSANEECEDNVCKLHGGDGDEDGAGGDDAADHDAGDDHGDDGVEAGDDNGVDDADEPENENEEPDTDDEPEA
jgi:hypothetical protein